jgi:hypothetical protein
MRATYPPIMGRVGIRLILAGVLLGLTTPSAAEPRVRFASPSFVQNDGVPGLVHTLLHRRRIAVSPGRRQSAGPLAGSDLT